MSRSHSLPRPALGVGVHGPRDAVPTEGPASAGRHGARRRGPRRTESARNALRRSR
jgi:hypothetical protein